MLSPSFLNRALVLAALISACMLSRVASESTSGETPDEVLNRTEIYSEKKLADGWADYSWEKDVVDYESEPGQNSSTAIDVRIGAWGGFSLAHISKVSHYASRKVPCERA